MKISPEVEEDDCCMTSTVNNHGVYVVGKQKAGATKQTKADAKRIADAIKQVAIYKKK